MRDNAVVLSVQDNLALVCVTARDACHSCSARTLCAGQRDDNGNLQVFNPLRAQPGDEVEIEVPEGNYTKDLIKIFSFLLLGTLGGLGTGYMLASFLSSSPAASGLFGLLGGLALAAVFIHRSWRGRLTRHYPVIVEITQKGGLHG